MTPFNLKIKSPVTGKWEFAELFTEGSDSVIALTKEANPIGEMKSRRSDMSNLVRLPLTPKNTELMGFASEITEAYRSPYQHIPCRVEQEGITIYGKGAYSQIIEVTQKHFEIKVYSGIADLFVTLRDSRLRDLPETGDFGLARVNWSVFGVASSYNPNNYNGYAPFAAMDWNTEESPTAIDDTLTPPALDVRTLYPCVRLPRLLESILGNAGYKLSTDVATDPVFLSAAIPCVSGVKKTEKTEWAAEYEVSSAPQNNTNLYHFSHLYLDGNFHIDAANTSLSFINAPAPGRYYFRIQLKSEKGVRILFSQNSAHLLTVRQKGNVSIEPSFDLAQGDSLSIMIADITLGACDAVEVGASLYNFEPEEVDTYPNTSFPVVMNLPDVSQLDIVKLFLLMFGQMVNVNERTKTLECFSFQSVYEKKKPRLDWSAKLDRNFVRKEFMYGSFGQNNLIKYKDTEYSLNENKTVTIKSVGQFPVNNQHLEKEKTLFEFEASAVDEAAHFNFGLVAKVRYRTAKVPEASVPLMALALNTYSNEGQDVLLLRGNGSSQDTDRLTQEAIFANFSPLQANTLVSNYYERLTNGVMRKCKIFTERLLLTPVDMATFDQSRPIWLNKYNCYFFVNKINNYRPGRVTEVELVALFN